MVVSATRESSRHLFDEQYIISARAFTFHDKSRQPDQFWRFAPVDCLRSDHIGLERLNENLGLLARGAVVRQILLPHN